MDSIKINCYRGSLLLHKSGQIDVDVPAEAIAHGLAGVGRFGRQTPRTYSVAEHSIKLSWLLEQEHYGWAHRAAALIHDAPEAFGIGDLNTFVKHQLLDLSALTGLENRMVEAFWKALGLERRFGEWAIYADIVHKFDKWIGHYEAHRFGFYVPPEVGFNVNLYNPRNGWNTIDYWDDNWAKQSWMHEWNMLTGQQ